ncbi:hypothetical protein ACPUER_11990 [Burkholderia sp. DN3021]|uniref:hypothetical protein n=1 Tax=Burkholderia sp. DN3021 TaxID=3410137 RepID=UPI003C7D0234
MSTQQMGVVEKARIQAACNRLAALDALPCDTLEKVAAHFMANASCEEIDSLRGTLRILFHAVKNREATTHA